MDDSPPERSPRLGHSTQSSMSLASGSTLLDDQDEDVRIAVRALGDMKNGSNRGFINSSLPTTSLPSPTLSISSEAPVEPDFVSRVSNIPLVNNALRMYEQGKASSRVVKYGAEIMESSVKSISRPVIERLPTSQLDDFARRQLDRFDRYRKPSQSAQDGQDRGSLRSLLVDNEDSNAVREREEDVTRWVNSTESSQTNSHPSRSPTPTYMSPRYESNQNTTYPVPGPSGYSQYQDQVSNDRDQFNLQRPSPQSPQQENQQQVMQRSRWQTMLLEAGGFGAAWSEESMRKLRYVLQWLQYATNHIDQQILAIRDFTESLQQHYFDPVLTEKHPSPHTRSTGNSGHSRSVSESQSQAISSAQMHKLTSLRRDVIHTVRDVVSVVSKYGGGAALPEPARNTMKGFILKLPKKVGEAMKMGPHVPSEATIGSTSVAGPSVSRTVEESVAAAASGRAGSDRRATRRGRGDRGIGGSSSAGPSPLPSRANSPTASPRMHSTRAFAHPTSTLDHDHQRSTMTAGTAVMAANRILTLATESLDMMRGVTGVVKDSLDRADAWVERLKMMGVHHQRTVTEDQHSDHSSGMAPRNRMNLDLSPGSMQYRERDFESDSALLSPLSLQGRSRRESIGSNAGYASYGGSLPSTPGLSYPHSELSSYAPSHTSSNLPLAPPPVDAPSPEVGLGLRRMSIRSEEVEIKEEETENKMELDS